MSAFSQQWNFYIQPTMEFLHLTKTGMSIFSQKFIHFNFFLNFLHLKVSIFSQKWDFYIQLKVGFLHLSKSGISKFSPKWDFYIYPKVGFLHLAKSRISTFSQKWDFYVQPIFSIFRIYTVGSVNIRRLIIIQIIQQLLYFTGKLFC